MPEETLGPVRPEEDVHLAAAAIVPIPLPECSQLGLDTRLEFEHSIEVEFGFLVLKHELAAQSTRHE